MTISPTLAWPADHHYPRRNRLLCKKDRADRGGGAGDARRRSERTVNFHSEFIGIAEAAAGKWQLVHMYKS